MTQKNERIFTRRYANIMFADMLQRIAITMLGALLPLYMVDMGYSKMVAGLTTTLYMLVAVVCRPIVGRLVDTKGRWISLVIGTVVFVIASGFYSASIPLPLFLTMRALQGLGFAFIGTSIMTMATDIIPRHRMSEGIGYMGLTHTLARAFFPMVALTLKDAFGYQTTYLVIFGVALLDVLVALTLREVKQQGVSAEATEDAVDEKREQAPAPPRKETSLKLWERLVDRDALKPSLIILVTMFAGSSTMTFIIVYAAAKGVANPGVFFTASAIAIAVGRLAVGRLSQRFGSVAVLAPGMLLSSVSMLILFWMDGVGILVVSGILSGLAGGMMHPELQSLAVLLAREERRGLANSTFYMMMDLGTASGAVALGVMADYTGLESIFLTGAILVFVGLLGYLFFERRGAFSLS